LLSLRSRKSARCGEVRALAEAKNRELETRIKAMRAMTRTLDRLIVSCDDTSQPAGQCPILHAFNGAGSKPPKR
jgi:MerR family Zn(II)-responsive transcriptional regulator of zntA